jgi:SAM-dependent methyltransferase
VINQCRKPMGWLGRFVLWSMNSSHSKLTDWGLGHVSVGKGDTILDVGCGGGRTVSKLAAIATDGKVYGIDYSEESVAASKRSNARGIDIGRVEIRQGSVSQLPFWGQHVRSCYGGGDPLFLARLAWGCAREVFRVLKPGARSSLLRRFMEGRRRRVDSLRRSTPHKQG